MTVSSKASLTLFPSFSSHKPPKQNTQLQTPPDSDFEAFCTPRDMASSGSPAPFIKDEPDDMSFNHNRILGQNGYDMQSQYDGQQFGTSHGGFGSVNPSDLTMGNANFMNNQFPSHMMSSSFQSVPNGGIADEELLELGSLDDPNGHNNDFNYYNDSMNGTQMGHNQMNQIFSSTPDGAPIQSPFLHDFNYNQFQSMHSRQPFHNNPGSASMPNGGFDMGARQRKMPGMDRHASDSRSPMSPKTPALGGLNLGTPDSGSFPSQPIMTGQLNPRHQKTVPNQWDNTPGSRPHSWVESPIPSPHAGIHHTQISEVLATGKHASLPAKVEMTGATVAGLQSQEAKRRRRRESHNMVERRRRDNINERIHDLSRLVPQHRLEDEKIRKHLHNNGPLSPSIAAGGISPPGAATSLLAGGTGRRAAGNITQGLPIEEKDKGPNKGDILNGAVGWTRDLMWMLYRKFEHEEQLKEIIEQLGGQVPYQQNEDEKRMRTELIDAVNKNGTSNFRYSRGPGSGLRVPKHTNIAGEPLEPLSPQGLSPALQSGGSGSNSGGGQPQFFFTQPASGSSGHNSFSLKEEDEYGMDMG